MNKVSIIMPVFNCEKYLGQSIDSVLHQSLEEWELLCIDDGSTDDSLSVLKQYQLRDRRIKVYTQSNQGAGAARNLGMQYAEGEFIAFLDADDYYYDEEALNEMYEACIKNNVNACGSMIKLLRGKVIGNDAEFSEIRNNLSENSIFEYCAYQFDYGYCGFIFRTSKIREYSITFPLYRRFQDPPFLVKIMYYIGSFTFIDKSLYCYRTPNVASRFDVIKTIDLLKGLIDNMEFAMNNELTLLFERTVRRLEVEYNDIILYNVSSKNTDILDLLLRANQLVRQFKKDNNYVIVPLEKIFESVSEAGRIHREKLYSKMVASKRIYLYGAGSAAEDCLLALQSRNLFDKVIAILVTSMKGNPEEIKGIPVISSDNYQYLKGDLILITVTNIHSRDIINNRLQNMQVQEYEMINVGMFENV